MRSSTKPAGGRRGAGPILVAAVVAMLVVGCTPNPGGPPAEPGPPTISKFTATPSRAESPALVVFRWSVADPRNDPLRCRLDVDSDGVWDHERMPCRSRDSVMIPVDSATSATATLEVSDADYPPVTATATYGVGAVTAETYNIDLDLDPAMSPEFRSAFESAAQRWESVIPVGVSDTTLSLLDGLFGWIPAYDGPVDDIRIVARDTDIDGPGKILGRAGALLARAGDFQPYFGFMEFDTADLEQLAAAGQLHSVILHEMGHVIGLGPGWILSGFVSGPIDPHYEAPFAIAAYQQLGGDFRVPLENEGGVGTLFGHWRESTFDDELMTGYLGSSDAEPLSVLSVAALADFGYGVALDRADPYVLPRLRTDAFARGLASLFESTDEDGRQVHERPHTEQIGPFTDGLPSPLPDHY